MRISNFKYQISNIIILMMILCSCSTQKNTRATRSFHQTKVKYNILYNGNIAYEEGLKAIRDANTDDYSGILPLYPVSNHQAAQAASTQMDKTIEKCRKCIKLHSIKAKPKRDPKKASDPKYKLWLQSEEFNANMDLAWMRLGEAEFHKGDFLGSVSTFNYIIRHYSNDPDIIAQCQLWIARGYAEMGWQYEAEDMLQRVQIDALSRKHAKLYSAVKADVLLKGGHYHEAIPFVKIAMPHEKRKIYRPRFAYVLGQLYEREGNKSEAVRAYQYVVRMAPPTEMEFNARIRIAELSGKGAIRSLRAMARQSKYKDRLDQIYGTIGNIYLQHGDTAQALEMYEKAIAEATQAGTAKAAVLVRAGDIYFEQHAYVPAQPCYREAFTILTAEHSDYPRVQKRSEVLDELIVSYTQAQLQDSLQRLGHMSEEEQRAIVDRIIADLIEAEKADSIKQAQAARELARGDGELKSVNTANMLGGGGQKGEWYFYNPQLIKQGKQEWLKRWGNRPLEDNWRRQNKQVVINDDMSAASNDENDSTLLGADSTAVRTKIETDAHKPEYYLQQIPKTEEDYAVSDSLWRDAMVALYYIYRDKLEDDPQAQETLRRLEERFPSHASVAAIYEDERLRALRHDEAYIAKMRKMLNEQDSLYAATYDAYKHGRYAEVKSTISNVKSQMTNDKWSLAPRFLFLNAISVARTEGQQPFIEALQDLVANYGETELGSMAKDMLAMMGQGMESQKGGATGSLADLRNQSTEQSEQEEASDAAQQWSEDRKQPSVVLLILPTAEEQALNDLQYEVALFNFSQFLIRDFDLQKMPVWGETAALRISGFADLDEAEWWIGLAKKNPEMQAALQDIQIKAVAEVNLPLLK
jgi:tetratricopeptide (TPR) repeat protein